MARITKKRRVHWLGWLCVLATVITASLFGIQQYQHYQLVQTIAQAKTVKVRPVKPAAHQAATSNKPQATYWDQDDRGRTVGQLAIPSVGIKLPVIKGIGQTDGQDNMLKAAVTNKQNQTMGQRNYVLSSHQIAQANVLFSPLHETKIGALIYLTDRQTVYTYKTVTHKVVKANQVSILDDVAGQRLITLYTCDPNGELVNGQTYERVVVVGRLVRQAPATSKNLARF